MSVASGYRWILSGIRDDVGDVSVFGHAVVLTGVLCVVVPGTALTTGVPVLVALAVAGGLYGVVLLVRRETLAGLVAATLVFVTFAADVPLLTVPAEGGVTPTLQVMLVDLAVLPLLGVSLHHSGLPTSLPSLSMRTLPGYTLAAFVAWTVVAAALGGGPSPPSAFVYAATQLRHLALLAAGTVVLRYVSLRTAVGSLLAAVSGHALVAVFESIRHGTLGLTTLGDADGFVFGNFEVLFVAFQSSTYAGGFVGNSRVLVALFVLLSPFALLGVVSTSRSRQIGGTAFLATGAIVLRISESDTGLVAFLGSLALASLGLWWVRSDRTTTREWRPAATTGGVLGVALLLFRTRTTAVNAGGETGGGTAGDVVGGSGLAESSSGVVSGLADAIPLLSSANVSTRIAQYFAALDLSSRYPLFGIGGWNFPRLVSQYGLEPVGLHNLYLSVLVGTGVPGFVLFGTALAALFVATVGAALRDGGDRREWVVASAGLLGFFGFVFWTFVNGGGVAFGVFWLLAGALLAAIPVDGDARAGPQDTTTESPDGSDDGDADRVR